MSDILQAKELCREFIGEMSENRSGYDDAGVARLILADLQTYGYVQQSRKRRLSHWCHTNGNPFKRGMPLAQRISMALFDRIIPREN